MLEIESFLHDFKKGNLFVTEYYTSLVVRWQQLDLYEPLEWKCQGDATLYAKLEEEKWIFKFLLGLYTKFDEVRGRIMSLDPLPLLREVFFTIRNEESKKRLTSSELSHVADSQLSALLSKGAPFNDSQTKRNRWCDHCKKLGHTREIC